jgi:multidrug efflux pump subunit AcrB
MIGESTQLLFPDGVARGLIAAGGFNPSQLSLMVLVLGVAALLLLLTRRRLRESQNSPQAYAREQIRRIRDERKVNHEVQDVMVELQQVSRQINAQLETRFAKLESAIRSADERIDRLTRLLRQADGQSTVDVTVSEDAPAVDPAAQPDSIRRLTYQLADAGRTPFEVARQLGITTGEVELMLALRPTTTCPASAPR